MATSENKVYLKGRLTRDAKVFAFENGGKAARFNLATSEMFKRGDDWVEKSQFHPCVVFGKAADAAAGFKQGDVVEINGTLEHRQYEKDGHQKDIAEVIARNKNHSVALVEKYEPKAA